MGDWTGRTKESGKTRKYLLPHRVEAYSSFQEVLCSHSLLSWRIRSQELLIFIFHRINSAVLPSLACDACVKTVTRN